MYAWRAHLGFFLLGLACGAVGIAIVVATRWACE